VKVNAENMNHIIGRLLQISNENLEHNFPILRNREVIFPPNYDSTSKYSELEDECGIIDSKYRVAEESSSDSEYIQNHNQKGKQKDIKKKVRFY